MSKPRFIESIKFALFTMFKIPMIRYARPCIVNIDDSQSHIIIPLSFRTKNHIRSMYFGALSVGADLCIGLLARHHIDKIDKTRVLLFKDFKINFLKTAKSDVHFICREGDLVKKLVEDLIRTNERQNQTIHGIATTPKISGDTVVAEFSLTLSVK